MLLIIHIVVALSSLIFTGFTFVRPSKTKLEISYGLFGFTLSSGTVLVWTTHAGLVQACMTGLLYSGLVLPGIVLAQYRFAKSSHSTDKSK